MEIALSQCKTNLPTGDAGPTEVAQLYKERWGIETLFFTVTENFNGEINTLAYPKAALFSYCMAIIAYHILATLRAALGTVHGRRCPQSGTNLGG